MRIFLEIQGAKSIVLSILPARFRIFGGHLRLLEPKARLVELGI